MTTKLEVGQHVNNRDSPARTFVTKRETFDRYDSSFGELLQSDKTDPFRTAYSTEYAVSMACQKPGETVPKHGRCATDCMR